jgi:hypothetical protein
MARGEINMDGLWAPELRMGAYKVGILDVRRTNLNQTPHFGSARLSLR